MYNTHNTLGVSDTWEKYYFKRFWTSAYGSGSNSKMQKGTKAKHNVLMIGNSISFLSAKLQKFVLRMQKLFQRFSLKNFLLQKIFETL